MADNYGYYNDNNEYNGRGNNNNNGRANVENINVDKVNALINAIKAYPLEGATEEDKRRVLDLVDIYISTGAEDPSNPGVYMYDMYITTSQPIRGDIEDVEEEEEGNANNNENNLNFNRNYNIDRQQRQRIKQGGLSPYIYAYLTHKYEIFDILTDYIINKEYVFNAIDLYDYRIADYALENKDFDLYYKIVAEDGGLHYYTNAGAKVPNEEGNSERNDRVAGLHFIHYTDSNYRKMIKKYTNTYNKGKPIQGFHGNLIQLPRAPVAPVRSRKHVTTNEPLYSYKTFRSRRYGPKKDLLMPVESKAIRDWIQAQTDYLESSDRIKYIVASYTRNGDELVNMYLRKLLFDERGKLNEKPQRLLNRIRELSRPIPFLYQIVENYEYIIAIYKKMVASNKIKAYGTQFPPRSEIERDGKPIQDKIKYFYFLFKDLFDRKEILGELLKLYAYDLNTIIENSPKLPDSIIVYRGVEREFELPEGKTEYTTKSFLSTSLSPESAGRFLKEIYPTLHCCLYEISIPKTLHVLYTAPVSHFKREYEILLPLHIRMRGADKILLKRTYGYEDRILVREMTAKGIHIAPPVRKLRTMRMGNRRITQRIKRKSKRSVRKSRKASAKKSPPKSPRKPLGGAGGPPPSSNNSS